MKFIVAKFIQYGYNAAYKTQAMAINTLIKLIISKTQTNLNIATELTGVAFLHIINSKKICVVYKNQYQQGRK